MENILELKNITKLYPGVLALDDVSLCVQKGSVHAIMGENGAGKSTLMKVLNGVTRQNSGEIYFEGEPVSIKSTQDAIAFGISMIYQELNPIKDLTIAENIFMGRFPLKAKNIVDWKETYRQCEELFQQWDIRYSPRAKVRSLRIADIQMIDIIKAISFNARLIVMDEPTSSISEKEVDKLLGFIRELKAKNITVIIITHKLDEVFKIADRVTVLRDGKYIDTQPIERLDKEKLITMMVGREIKSIFPPKTHDGTGECIFEAKSLNRGKRVKDVSFQLRKGEILGFSGLVGSGRTETMRCIFGLDELESGDILLNGERLPAPSPRKLISKGVMMLTEDRKESGLVLCRSVLENISLPSLYVSSKHGIIEKKSESERVQKISRKLQVKTPSLSTIANSLSGGNQQKVILAKWLMMQPLILIMDEPTRGIDVGAKAEIFQIMRQLVANGVSVIFISSEMEEILGMSDRVVVMSEGRITGVLEHHEICQETIMAYSAER